MLNKLKCWFWCRIGAIAQLAIVANAVIVGAGYIFGIELFKRGFSGNGPYQRVTTVVFYLGLALALRLQKLGSHIQAGVIAMFIGFLSFGLMMANWSWENTANARGLEYMLTGVKGGNPSQFTLLVFILHALAFFVIIINKNRFPRIKRGSHIAAMVICASAFVGHLLRIPQMFFDLPGFSYGMAQNTAFIGLVFGLACTVQIWKLRV